MDPKELRGLMEAYSEVYAPQEVDEAVKGASRHDTEMRKASAAERRGGDKRLSPSKGKGYADQQNQQISYMDKLTKKNKNIVVGMTHEELDIFDVVLEFLQAEGYAETLEEAEWMMANVLDEEAIDIILGEKVILTKTPYGMHRTEVTPTGTKSTIGGRDVTPRQKDPKVERDSSKIKIKKGHMDESSSSRLPGESESEFIMRRRTEYNRPRRGPQHETTPSSVPVRRMEMQPRSVERNPKSEPYSSKSKERSGKSSYDRVKEAFNIFISTMISEGMNFDSYSWDDLYEMFDNIFEADVANKDPDRYERQSRRTETRGQSAERRVRGRLATMDPDKRDAMIKQMRAVGLNV